MENNSKNMKTPNIYNSGIPIFYSPPRNFKFLITSKVKYLEIKFYPLEGLNEIEMVFGDDELKLTLSCNLGTIKLFNLNQNNEIKIIYAENQEQLDSIEFFQKRKEIIVLLKDLLNGREIFISNEYIPYKQQIIEYLNKNFTSINF
jgi:hypothetical protein